MLTGYIVRHFIFKTSLWDLYCPFVLFYCNRNALRTELAVERVLIKQHLLQAKKLVLREDSDCIPFLPLAKCSMHFASYFPSTTEGLLRASYLICLHVQVVEADERESKDVELLTLPFFCTEKEHEGSSNRGWKDDMHDSVKTTQTLQSWRDLACPFLRSSTHPRNISLVPYFISNQSYFFPFSPQS